MSRVKVNSRITAVSEHCWGLWKDKYKIVETNTDMEKKV